MTHNPEALHILRRAGDEKDDAINFGETALALAAFEKSEVEITPYRNHLDSLIDQVKKECKYVSVKQAEDQLEALRKVLVIKHEYKGDESFEEDPRSNNLMEVIDRKCGSPIALGILYLHVARALGWAMTGLDLCGHFLLRLSAQDGQIIIDPFRSGQVCQIEEASDILFDEDDEEINFIEALKKTSPVNLSSDILKPVSARSLLLKLQHAVKKRLIDQNRIDTSITTLHGMILFAPRRHDLWKELGYLQAERGHLRAAINALEVVKDLAEDPLPGKQTDVVLKELRWRLN